MRLLLDTHIFLWSIKENPALPAFVREAIGDPVTELFLSVASVWEMAIKTALGKMNFPIERTTAILEQTNCTPLAISIDHAIEASRLPHHHGDPFDRMLVAQARREGLTLVTTDKAIRLYAVSVLGEESRAD